ncbi:Gfo/Idh/MocA family oxidoreductase [Paenibacillus sp. TRM 82003]|nr:Gfo/Idh/MocA family oxidoreductase [Paenibacillus sp. TRM 82003]
MKTIRWGIIGCGDVTEVKSGPAFQKAEGSALTAVMRRNGTLAKDYAERHGVPKWYDTGEALIHDPEVDAVYIATPPAHHKEYALLAAQAGKPVYVEKPMALNSDECREMIDACEKAGVPLFVAFYRRMQPRFLKVKELLEQNAIGEVRLVLTTHHTKPANPHGQGAWRLQPEIGGGGLFPDLASHTLDLLDYFLGPIETVEGLAANQAGRYAAEDIVTTAYRFATGVHGIGSWCFEAGVHEDRNEIIGSAGKIVYSTFADEPIRLVTDQGTREWHIEQPQHVQQPLIQSIVNELRGTGEVCPSTGRSGARTNRVMDTLLIPFYRAKNTSNQ